jgi:hypothetical protein
MNETQTKYCDIAQWPAITMIDSLIDYFIVVCELCTSSIELVWMNELNNKSCLVFVSHPLLFSCYPWISKYCDHNERGEVQTKHKKMRNNTEGKYICIYKQSTKQMLPTSIKNIYNKETAVKQATNQNPLWSACLGPENQTQKCPK